MGKWLFAAILFSCGLIVIQADLTAKCNRLMQNGKCSFYQECIESRVQCGSEGYAIAYAKKYCQVFDQNLLKFDKKGRKWVQKTKTCLMEVLNNNVNSSWSCSDVFKVGYNSHTYCYKESGICDVVWSNLKAFYSVFSTDTPAVTSIPADFVKQVTVTALGCMEHC